MTIKRRLLYFINGPFTFRIKNNFLFAQLRYRLWKSKGCPLPPPHIVKQRMISGFINELGYATFVETGTYLGAMILTILDDFSQIYTIELSKDLYQRATKVFRKFPHVKCLQGDSGEVMLEVVKKIHEGAIFWLDGHYSSGITVLGNKVCPIFEELGAIFKYDNFNHLILIDDARLFLQKEPDYPSYAELVSYIKKADARYNIYVLKTDTIVVTKADLNASACINNNLQSV
jgi:hypothetical protein